MLGGSMSSVVADNLRIRCPGGLENDAWRYEMTMGTGLVLVAIGAILRYAVKDEWDAVDLTTVGLILMIVGAVAFIVGAIYAFSSRTPGGPSDPPYPPDQRY
jgi:hypothetical protein